jgi:hypothetical protein
VCDGKRVKTGASCNDNKVVPPSPLNCGKNPSPLKIDTDLKNRLHNKAEKTIDFASASS